MVPRAGLPGYRAEPSARTEPLAEDGGGALILGAPVARRWTKPRTWDGPTVLGRLHEWIGRYGPPASYEWALNADTLVRLGLPTAGRERWEREYPHWPSTQAVICYYGSWTAALAMAGVDVRPRLYEQSLQHRITAARNMHAAGEPTSTIAAALGVCERTVENYLAASVCGACGQRRVVSARAGRCRRCDQARRGTWARDDVLRSLRRWTESFGHPPLARQWEPKHAGSRWLVADPPYPTATTVQNACGSWAAARALAGLPVLRQSWTATTIIQALQMSARRAGRPPASDEWESARGELRPSASTVRRHFGSWSAALDAAGLH